MQKRIIQVGLAGMNQDVINPKVNTLFAYEIKNFRINSTGHSNGIELTSERGTKPIKLKYNGLYSYNIADIVDFDIEHNDLPIGQTAPESDYEVIGLCVLGDHLVLFIQGYHYEYNPDYGTTPIEPEWLEITRNCILRLDFVEEDQILHDVCFNVVPLFFGDLGFDRSHKIECIPYMESTDIQKVYWIDGINYPRVMNIVREGGYADYDENEDPFSFYQKISSGGYNTIDVEKIYVGGLFYAGVIQYAFSFYNKNALETPIIYTTSLNYISHSDRGEVANKQLGCAFDITVKINIEDHDNFEYVRVYSIYRSSINGTPVVKVIKDTKCDDFTDDELYYSITFTDTNELGYDFDAYRILINSDHIKPNAIGHKDLKMFLGNYETDGTLTSDDRFMSGYQIQWLNNSSDKQIQHFDSLEDRYYDYINQLSLSDGLNKTKDSSIIKTFKYGEYYKLGLLFQDEFGNWSGVYPVATLVNDKHPVYYNQSNIRLPYAQMTLDIGDIYDLIYNDNPKQYKKVRPVISYPTLSERSILCQGIINPTVFNLTDRCDKNCFSLASWFFRPYPFENGGTHFEQNTKYKTTNNNIHKYNGAICQFKHYEPLFPSDDIGCEILGMYFDESERTKKSITQIDVNDDDLSRYKNYYFVDHSICTLNSPDIDFDDNLKNVDYNQYNVRLIGIVPFTSNYGNYNVVAESPLFLYDKNVGTESDVQLIQGVTMASGFEQLQWKQRGGWHSAVQWCAGSQQVSALNCWFDDLNGYFDMPALATQEDPLPYRWNYSSREASYYVYPWNKEYLNNYSCGFEASDVPGIDSKEDINSSKVLRKVLSNVKFSRNTFIFDDFDDQLQLIDTSSLKLFDLQDNDGVVKIQNDIFYKGNVDSLLTYDSLFLIDKIPTTSTNYIGWIDNQDIKVNGYPIMFGGVYAQDLQDYNRSKRTLMEYSEPKQAFDRHIYNTLNVFCQSPIMMRYKSMPHIVFQIRDTLALQGLRKTQNLLPIKYNSFYRTLIPEVSVPWDTNTIINISQNEINLSNLISDSAYSDNVLNENNCGYLWLGELYKNDSNPYRNNDFNDSKDRVWVPCGKLYNLIQNGTEHVQWIEGDTYFQRYDCLKTYPYSNEDYQSVVEIASFMVETHINLDGRYDENRGLIDNTFVNPTNFNLINPVYSLTNNFFQYNVLDEEDFKTTDFPTRFTWSLNKINGLDIDEWTRTNTAAFYDCDGDKGSITSLRRFNNQIYAFQEKGISRIKYNENVAINTNNGTPIELGNSLSVNGVEYLSELVGSQNKWSNISTPNGIFFTDNYTAGLYRLGGGERVLTNLTKNTLQRWFESNNANHDFINTASFDANMNEIHFMFGNESLAYNNDFGTFTSFYDYRGMVGNIKNHSFNITGNSIYFLRESNKYNSFYGTKKPYWISFVANSNIEGYSPSNAIYDNVWYKADVLHSTKTDNFNYDELIQNTDDVIPDFSKDTGWYETFNKIVVGNDYQYAENRNQTKNFDFIKKFRTWRVPVPRQDRARMRNSWLRIRLENTKPSYDKMVLRDIYVDSFF